MIDEEQLAVLYVLQPAALTKAECFSRLPMILRHRWSENYLADWILRDLIREGYLDTMMIAPGTIAYRLTPLARQYLRGLAV